MTKILDGFIEGILPLEIRKHLIELSDNFFVYEFNDLRFPDWKTLYFFTRTEGCDDLESDVFEIFARVQGSSGLKEMRHTYFGDKGYIFYLNKYHMNLFLIYCSKYFDING